MDIQISRFDELTVPQLYAILALRTQVFVVEQNCAYQEVDDHDQGSIHILGMEEKRLVAYGRVVGPGEVYTEPSIGRVCVTKDQRGHQCGRKIFAAALQVACDKFPRDVLKIQAQVYLESFYQSFGFETVSKPYPDFGIWHVDMLRKPG